jgi:hypothetical protein
MKDRNEKDQCSDGVDNTLEGFIGMVGESFGKAVLNCGCGGK